MASLHKKWSVVLIMKWDDEMNKKSANQGGQVQSQLTEIELHCIAQHHKQWYYLMIGNEKLDYEAAFEKACENCEKQSECSENTFVSSLKKLSKVTGVQISIMRK